MAVGKTAGRLTALSVGAIASVIVLTLAVLFANSYSTGLVTANARALHSTNSLLGSSAILRAANNQAALFARSVALGTADEAARDVAIQEAVRTLETFETVAEEADPSLVASHPDLRAQVAGLVAASSSAMESAADGDYTRAFEVLETQYEPTWSSLRDRLRETQAETVNNIRETETVAGWVGTGTRFLAILLLPLAAIIIYRRIVRTQVRERRLEFEARLEYEKKLNASKDELLAGVSHQLRTPVTGIYGMSDILADDDQVAPETVKEFVGLIRTEAYDLDRVLADLLVTARLDADALTFEEKPFLVANAVQRAVDPLRKSGLEVEIDLDGPVRAFGDLDRVVHILRNLLSNAHKHGGAQITVKGRVLHDQIEVAVEDNGSDRPDEAVLFTGFDHGGVAALTTGSVGLGLSVARRLARGMGGEVAYERSGDRSRFVLSLSGVVPSPVEQLVETSTA